MTGKNSPGTCHTFIIVRIVRCGVCLCVWMCVCLGGSRVWVWTAVSVLIYLTVNGPI